MGAGGCRTDFVTGWLSVVLPTCGYVHPWLISPAQGASHISRGAHFLDELVLRQPAQAEPCVQWLMAQHAQQSGRWLLQKSHARISGLDECLPLRLRDKITVLNIVCDDQESTVTALWEFLIKTFIRKDVDVLNLCQANLQNVWQDKSNFRQIQSWHSDDEYCAALDVIIDHYVQHSLTTRSASDQHGLSDVRDIAYCDLLQPHGKQQLADILEFTLDDNTARIWDQALVLAKTAHEYRALGRVWSKQDIRSRVLAACAHNS